MSWLAKVPPLSWLVSLSEHFPWAYVMALFLIPLTLAVLWQGLVYFRARQVGYSRAYGPNRIDRFSYFKDGRKRGRLIDQDKAYERRITWPRLIFPLYFVAVCMFLAQGIWFHPGTYVLLAFLWFVFTPVRKIMGIWAARKVFILKHGDDSLPNTFWQDVAGYYESGWSTPRSAEKRKPYSPLFDKGIVGTPLDKICQAGYVVFGPGSPLWSLLRVWDWPMFFCDLVILAAWAMIWPVACCCTPEFYLQVVKDFNRIMQPWWQWSKRRRRSYDATKVKVVKGEVIKDDEDVTATYGNSGTHIARRGAR